RLVVGRCEARHRIALVTNQPVRDFQLLAEPDDALGLRNPQMVNRKHAFVPPPARDEQRGRVRNMRAAPLLQMSPAGAVRDQPGRATGIATLSGGRADAFRRSCASAGNNKTDRMAAPTIAVAISTLMPARVTPILVIARTRGKAVAL